MTRFTKTAVIKALEEIVEELGEDYVYPNDGNGCWYAINGEPSCIAGRVFAKLDPEFFEEVAAAEKFHGNSFLVTSLERPGERKPEETENPYALPVLNATEAGRLALARAQNAQDGEMPYKVALRDAKASRA